MTKSCKNEVLVKRTGVGLSKHVYSNTKHEAYARSLGIPPNYPEVEICAPGGDVLYVAKDSKGRTQTRYSKEYNENREEAAKPEHIRQLTPEVWEKLDKAILAAISPMAWSVEKLAATAVLLIQTCFFRPGTRSAKGEDAHFGVVTLLVKHVKLLLNDTCAFEFVGKSGKTNKCLINGGNNSKTKTLCVLLKQLTRGKSSYDRLFRYNNHSLQVDELRDFLSVSTQGMVRPKDIRTYNANITFITALRDIPVGKTVAANKKRILEAIDRTSARLNNTRAIARKSYILVPVMKAAEAGKLDKIPSNQAPSVTLDKILNSKAAG